MPSSHRSAPVATLGAFVLVALVAACSLAPDAQEAARTHVEKTGRAALDAASTEARARAKDGVLAISFDEALRYACRVDLNLALLALERMKGAVGVEQAHSLTLPRVDIGVSSEIPIGSSDADTYFRGGLSLRYDLLDALFYKDAVARGEAGIRRAEHASTARVRAIGLDLLRRVSAHVGAREEATLCEDSLAMCRERVRIARLLLNAEGRAPDDMLAHEEEVARAVDRLAAASRGAEERRLEVNRLLGLDPDIVVELTDLDPLEEGATGRTVEETPEAAFTAAWNRLPEVRIAEIDLFLAEIGISVAKLGRLPRASADMELGSLDTQGSDSTAPALVNLDLSAPLLDWGDIRRRTTSRTLDREMMRQRIVALARHLRDRLRAADLDCRSTRARAADSMKRMAFVRRKASLGDRLRAAGRRDFLDRFTDGLALVAVEGEWRRRAIALGTAERVRRYETGAFPDPDVCEQIVKDAARAAEMLTAPPEDAPSSEQQ